MQNQQKIEWPRKLVVAKAYIDQLERSQALQAIEFATLRKEIQSAEKSNLNRIAVAKLKTLASTLEQSAGTMKSAADTNRLHALAEILKNPAR